MIVALQYWEGDLSQAMSLARLLADIEASPRSDVLLSLVCQPGTPMTRLVEKTIAHCSRKFAVEHVVSPLGAEGHPEGCAHLWAGTMRYYYEEYRRGGYPHEAIMTLDGGDGVPLHRDWIDVVMGEHAETVSRGKSITGSPYWLGGCPLHVNPNAVFQFSVLEKTSFLTDVPRHDGTLLTHFDIYHRREMLANASLSTIVHTDWRGGGNKISKGLMVERAGRSAWLHGYKDEDLFWVAREHLGDDPERPNLGRYDLGELYFQESLRRSSERRRSVE